MKYIIIFISLVSICGCYTMVECKREAKKIGVDQELCRDLHNREMIYAKFKQYSKNQINISSPSRTVDLDKYTKNVKNLLGRIKNLESEIECLNERKCDIPDNMPPPSECSREGWRN